jgi:hypothetical protein
LQRPAVALALLVLASGCGSSGQFVSATYEGGLDVNLNCPGQPTQSESDAMSMTLTRTGNTLTVDDPLLCAPLTATVNGDTATVPAQPTCAPRQFTAVSRGGSQTTTQTETVMGGALGVNGHTLAVNITSSVIVDSGSQSAKCTETRTGTLTMK